MTHLTPYEFQLLYGYGGGFEVIVERRDDLTDFYAFAETNVRGNWAFDWMHGEDRSASPEEKRQMRFLFADKEDAARFRLGFG